MKEKTINQINAFCQSNLSFALYKAIRATNYSITEKADWRNREFNMNIYTTESKVYEFEKVPFTNYIYRSCENELERFCGVYRFKSLYAHIDLPYKQDWNQFSFLISLHCDFADGIYIKANWYDAKFIKEYTFRVRSKSTLQDFDFVDYFKTKNLPKYFFPAGKFLDIQLANNCTKKEAIEIYKQLKATRTSESFEEKEFALQKQFARHLKRHFNLQVDEFFGLREMIEFKHKFGKRKRLTQVEPFPHCFDVIGDFDGDFDETLEEFSIINDELFTRNRPTIFV